MCVPDRPLDTSDLPADHVELSSWATSATAAIRLLLMFNVAGDPSPLHNLRGEPMLDVVTAALFVLGVGMAVARWRSGAVRADPRLAGDGAGRRGASSAETPSRTASRRFTRSRPRCCWPRAPSRRLPAGRRRATSPTPRCRSTWRCSWSLVIVGINGHALFVRRPGRRRDLGGLRLGRDPRRPRDQPPDLNATRIYLADVWIDDPTIRFLAHGMPAPRTARPGHHAAPSATTSRSPTSRRAARRWSPRIWSGSTRTARSTATGRRWTSTVVAVRSFRAPAKVVAEARGVTLRATPIERSRTNRYTLPMLPRRLAGRRRDQPVRRRSTCSPPSRSTCRASTACDWTPRPAPAWT